MRRRSSGCSLRPVGGGAWAGARRTAPGGRAFTEDGRRCWGGGSRGGRDRRRRPTRRRDGLRAATAEHVLCEKPVGRTAADLAPALRALVEHRRGFCVYYTWRRHPVILKLRELVRDGALGRLTSVELRMVTTQVALRDPSHWLFKREVSGGGILSWLGCHWLDATRFVTGQEFETVAALAGTLGGEAIDVEDVAAVSFRLTGGALGTLHAGYLIAQGRAGYEGRRLRQSHHPARHARSRRVPVGADGRADGRAAHGGAGLGGRRPAALRLRADRESGLRRRAWAGVRARVPALARRRGPQPGGRARRVAGRRVPRRRLRLGRQRPDDAGDARRPPRRVRRLTVHQPHPSSARR